MSTSAIGGKKASKGEERQGENEEIQRRDQDPHNLAYDEMKYSSDVKDDRGSRWWRAPDSKWCVQKPKGRMVADQNKMGESNLREH